MIFVTVGTQLPFDRLVRTMDHWAKRAKRNDVFAQIGRGSYTPTAIEWVDFLSPSRAADTLKSSDLIVSHAGIGTILTAIDYGKPLIIMPRRADLREHRNNHQVATARRLTAKEIIRVAQDEAELVSFLEASGWKTGHGGNQTEESAQLIGFLSDFLRKP